MKYPNKQILLVDDDSYTANSIIDILENEGFSFSQARNGLDAYNIACSENFDLIITDWDMPICNGIELIQKLKQNEHTERIPIIMLTGVMTQSNDLKMALETGANDFISKPIDKVILNARIHSVFRLVEVSKLRLEAQQQLSDSMQTALKNKLKHSRELLTQKTTQLAHISVNNNDFIKQLIFIKRFCSKKGEVHIDEQVKKLKIKKHENLEIEFMAQFEEDNPFFIEQLQERGSTLSYKEQKICAMISLGLSNKQVANFFSNSEGTIKSYRKLIRRKLNINLEINLREFLNNF